MTPEVKYELTTTELVELLKEAYRHGYATFEMVEAGLESYDAEGYARWAVYGLTLNKKDS